MRKIQLLGLAVLLVASAVFVISAVKLPVSAQVGSVKNDRVFAESNPSGLAQYHLSEWGSIANRQAGMEIYFQSERVEAYPSKINESGLDQYHQSEWHNK